MATAPQNRTTKISPALASRLADLPRDEVVRVVVLLNVPEPRTSGRRLTAAERAQSLAAARATTEGLWEQLRQVRHVTHAERVDIGGSAALGGVVVEIPARHVETFAAADQVRAVLEDQYLTRPQAT